MAHLVTDDAFDLFPVHHREQPRGRRDRGLVRADAGRERVGRWVVDDVHGRLRQAVADRQPLDDVVQLCVLLWIGWARARNRKHQARARRQREHRCEQREQPGDHHAGDDRLGMGAGHRSVRVRARGIEDQADNGADPDPDDEEEEDVEHGLALVGGDLLVHVKKSYARRRDLLDC